MPECRGGHVRRKAELGAGADAVTCTHMQCVLTMGKSQHTSMESYLLLFLYERTTTSEQPQLSYRLKESRGSPIVWDGS